MDNADTVHSTSFIRRIGKINHIPIKIIVLVYNSNEIFRYLVLFCLFVLFASLPPYLLFSYHTHKNLKELKQVDQVKFSSVGISESSQSLLVQDSQKLEAMASKDFMLFAWFKISKLPDAAERMILFRKYDVKSKNAPGYAASIYKSQDGLRAAIYWNNESSKRIWFNLAHFNIPPQEWFLFALTRLKNNSVGAHVIYKSIKNKIVIERLGGFKHEQGNLASSLGNLEFGAIHKGVFSGKVGPFGVLYSENLKPNLKSLFKGLYQNPIKNPSDFDFAQTQIWSPNAKEDLGPSKYSISLSRIRNRKRDRKK